MNSLISYSVSWTDVCSETIFLRPVLIGMSAESMSVADFAVSSRRVSDVHFL